VRVLLVTLLSVSCGGGRGDDPAVACGTMADHVRTLFAGDPTANDIREVFARRCTQDRWSAEMRDCVRATTSLAEPKNCRGKLTPTQSTALDTGLGAIKPQEERGVPDSCRAYETLVIAAMDCAELAADVRGDLASKLTAHKASWTESAAKEALDQQCRAGISALRQAAPTCFK
jgi:hypothetical protein